LINIHDTIKKSFFAQGRFDLQIGYVFVKFYQKNLTNNVKASTQRTPDQRNSIFALIDLILASSLKGVILPTLDRFLNLVLKLHHLTDLREGNCQESNSQQAMLSCILQLFHSSALCI
jgi:hypothetical protein